MILLLYLLSEAGNFIQEEYAKQARHGVSTDVHDREYLDCIFSQVNEASQKLGGHRGKPGVVITYEEIPSAMAVWDQNTQGQLMAQIFFSKAFLDVLEPEEMVAWIGHELNHIHRKHDKSVTPDNFDQRFGRFLDQAFLRVSELNIKAEVPEAPWERVKLEARMAYEIESDVLGIQLAMCMGISQAKIQSGLRKFLAINRKTYGVPENYPESFQRIGSALVVQKPENCRGVEVFQACPRNSNYEVRYEFNDEELTLADVTNADRALLSTRRQKMEASLGASEADPERAAGN